MFILHWICRQFLRESDKELREIAGYHFYKEYKKHYGEH